MLQVFLGIVVVVGISYLLIIVYQQYLLKQFREAKEKIADLKRIPLTQELNSAIATMGKGESLEELRQGKLKYDSIISDLFPTLNETLDDLSAKADSLKFSKIHQVWPDVKVKLKKATDDIVRIENTCHHLRKVTKEHESALVTLNKDYHHLEMKINKNSQKYVITRKYLQEKLKGLHNRIELFADLTKTGNQAEAQKILDDVNIQIKDLNDVFPKIIELERSMGITHVQQVKELHQDYDRLGKEGYSFPVQDFLAKLHEIKIQNQQNIQQLSQMNLKKADQGNKLVEKQIDHLYGILEKEIKAKEKVDYNTRFISRYIAHAQSQNKILSSKLEELSQNYILPPELLKEIAGLGEKIRRVSDKYHVDSHLVGGNKAVYSHLLKNQQAFNKTLREIEKKQISINNSLANFNEEEKKLRTLLKHYELTIYSYQRQINNLNLPGLPEEYLDYFDMTKQELSQVRHAMSKDQINLEEVKEELKFIGSDVDSLGKKTAEMVKSVVLSEQFMQYANKYRNSNPMVSEALKRTNELFNVDYDYQASLEVISMAISKVNEEAYKRITEGYTATTH